MILTGLRLRNFRQYKGTHQLAFAATPGKSTTVIMGQNGAGKTNLFQALNWCLYGKGMEGKGQILSKGLTAPDRLDGGFVEVHFRHDGFRYIARREVSPRGDEDEAAGDLELAELGADGRSSRASAPNQKLNTILPADARQYFFFDGERIDEMSRPGHEEQVREAIRSVLKLKVLERAVGHLNDVEAEYAQSVKKIAAANLEVQKLVDATEDLKARISELRSRRSQKADERAVASRQLEEVMAKLRSLQEIRGVMVEEKENTHALQTAEQRRKDLVEAAAELIARGGPAIALTRVREAAGILDDKRKRGEIPSSVRETLIEDLLEAGICICERHLDQAARQALRNRKKDTVPSAVEESILMATGYINSLEKVGSEIPTRLSAILRQITDIQDEMNDRHRRQEELREKLVRSSSEDIAGLERVRREIEGRVSDATYDLGRIDDAAETLERQQVEIRTELDRTEVQSAAVRREIRRYELARTASDAAEHLLKVFAEEMRKRIEAETDQIFKAMVWKEEHFAAARILEDYRLEVIDRYGASALRELSAGERQLLSLAFIVAMASVTGEEAPLVIDTPFGRISEEPLHNVAKTLPRLAGQLVLLVTDRELDDTSWELIKPYIGKNHKLIFDDSSGTTQIVEVK